LLRDQKLLLLVQLLLSLSLQLLLQMLILLLQQCILGHHTQVVFLYLHSN